VLARSLVCLTLLTACAGPSDAPAGDDTDVEVDVLPACPTFAAGVSAGTLASDELNEVSGIAGSRTFPGTWWMHNDSGDAARVFAVSADGASAAEFTFPDVIAVDWEDMALAPDGDAWSLLMGDIGDNLSLRPELLLWRVPEPDPAQPGPTAAPEAFHLRYPDGPHNAETLMVDPRTGDVYVVSKISDVATEVTQVFRAAAPLVDGATMEEVATLEFGGASLPGNVLTTGGDISPDGERIVIRTYDSAFVWRRTAHATVGEALATAPCPVPLATESQGEAIAWDPQTGGYATVSEFLHPERWTFAPQ
jgi:hypothetical protein